jgi:CheY-like chemotaxis protein
VVVKIERVMLVDDEAEIRIIGEMSLKIGGWEVMVAESGADAIEHAARVRPDVILLDVMMPGMDGPATLGKLRADPALASIPVIFMTAKVQKREIGRYLALGANGVISKPFDPMLLVDEVTRILEGG